MTTVSVRGGTASTASDRFHVIARYAAESGAMMAMEHLRQFGAGGDPKLSEFVDAGTLTAPVGRPLTELAAHNKLPGVTGNPFTASMGAWFYVEIYNDRAEAASGDDTNDRVIIRSTGHGPDNATSIVEWDVVINPETSATPCNVYGQENQSADNSGTNPCLGTVDTGVTARLRTN